MEFPDELLSPEMVMELAGKEPVLIAIIGRDEEGGYHPNVMVTPGLDDNGRAEMSAAVQKLAYKVGYPDLDVLEFFALSLVLLSEPYCHSPVMGMTAGQPFGAPEGFVKAFASILAGVGDKLGVDVGISDGTHRAFPLTTPHHHHHGAPTGEPEAPTGQYL